MSRTPIPTTAKLLMLVLATTLVATILVSVAAFGTSPGDYPELIPVDPISQTVNGYTVTLYPLYADANRIVVTYTVSFPHDDPRLAPLFPPNPFGTQSPRSLKLTNENGQVFPTSYAVDGVSDSKTIDTDRYGGELLAFDASELSKLPALPATLSLHLSMEYAKFSFRRDYLGSEYKHQVAVRGPFNFDFSMPVDPVRRIAEVNQTVETVTLERVVVTRHETRTFLKYNPGGLGFAGGPSFPYEKLEAGGSTQDDLGSRVFGTQLIDVHGEWKLEIWHRYMGSAYEPDQPGPVFRFTVPPVTMSQQEVPTRIATNKGSASVTGSPPVTPTHGLITPPIQTPAAGTVSQSVGGYMVTLQPVAADANRIVLRYTVTGPHGELLRAFGVRHDPEEFRVFGPQLFGKSGQALPLIEAGYPGVSQGDPFAEGIELTFDANPLGEMLPTVSLRLVVDLALGGSLPTPAPEPIAIDFSMPADKTSRKTEVKLTVDAEFSETITLRRVIVTASETHIVWQYDPPREGTRCSEPAGTLRIGKWSGPLTRPGRGLPTWRTGDSCTFRYDQIPLMNMQGDWTLNIESLAFIMKSASSAKNGPWVFDFELPPATP